MIKTKVNAILVPWNYSKKSQQLLENALKLADQSTSVRVVHVAVPLSGPDNGALFTQREFTHRKSLTERFWDSLPENLHDKRIKFDVEYGYVGRQLVRFATFNQVDLALFSKSEKPRFVKAFLGDVGAYLEKNLPCPTREIHSQESAASDQPNSQWLATSPSR